MRSQEILDASATLPSVSIYVISFNYGHFLAESIESALAQDYPMISVTVIDDGSTDSTPDIAAAFEQQIRYIRKDNGGLSDARNVAASSCDTPYLIYLDADDRMASNVVSSCVAALLRAPEYAYSYVQLQYFGQKTGRSDFPPETSRRIIRGNTHNACALFPTSLVREIGYDVRLRSGLEDWDFHLSLAENGHRGILNSEGVLHYRVHDASMGAGVSRRRWTRRRTYARIIVKHIRYIGIGGIAGFVARYLSNLKRRCRSSLTR